MKTRRGTGLLAVLAFALLTGAASPGDDAALLDAARRGDVAGVRSAIRGGANPNAAQGDGLTALHMAAEQGNLDIVKVLIDQRAIVEAKTRLGGYTPLHLASSGAHTAVVEALLAAGADPAAVTTTSHVTPLHLAAKAMNGEQVVRMLLERGAPVDAREFQAGQTPLMFAASFGRPAAVRELLHHGADATIATEVVDVLQRMAIDNAAQKQLRDALKAVRDAAQEGTDRELTAAEEQAAVQAQREFLGSPEQIAKVLEGFHPDNLAEQVPLWFTNSGLTSRMQMMARPIGQTLVGKTGGMTALHFAARDGQIETVKALLDGGVAIDLVSGDGSTALLLAILNGRFDLAMELIGRGADPSIATHTDGVSPLYAVLETQWAPFERGQPQAQKSQQAQYLDVLNALLEAGAEPNPRLKTHLFHFASAQVGLNATGATPFWRAAMAQDLDAMKALAAHGADPHIPTIWPEVGMRADRQQDGRQRDDSDLPRLEGQPAVYPIHAAAGGGYLGLGSDVLNSVPSNFLSATRYLIEEHGVDVNLPDSWGYTPLHYAAVRGGNDLIEYLVSVGADVTATTVLGQSPVDMARGGRAGFFERAPYPETIELLTKLGSPMKCLNTLFRGTGDYCEGTGVPQLQEEDRGYAGASAGSAGDQQQLRRLDRTGPREQPWARSSLVCTRISPSG